MNTKTAILLTTLSAWYIWWVVAKENDYYRQTVGGLLENPKPEEAVVDKKSALWEPIYDIAVALKKASRKIWLVCPEILTCEWNITDNELNIYFSYKF